MATMLPGLGGAGYTNPNPVDFGATAVNKPGPTASATALTASTTGQQPAAMAQPQMGSQLPQSPGMEAALGQAAQPSMIDILNQPMQENPDLAAKYGTFAQNSPTQTEDTAKKYQEFHESKQGTESPAQNPRDEIQSAIADGTPQQANPVGTFYDTYSSLDPVSKQMYDTIQQAISAPATQMSFVDEYNKLLGSQGIQGLQTELMDINRIMDGVDDDIRSEVTKSGGWASESQIQALAGARNKVFLKQAKALQQQLALRTDYVNQIMSFSQLDRKAVEDQVDRKLGLTQKLVDLQDKMTNAAKSNYQKIVDSVGFAGLANLFAGNPQGMKTAESILGLPQGALSNKAFLQGVNKPGEPFTLSPGSVRFDANGHVIASVPANAASGTPIPGVPGQLSPLAKAVKDGIISIDKVPIAQRPAVAAELAALGSPTERQQALTSNLEVVNSLLNNPSLGSISGFQGIGVLIPGTKAQLALNQYNQIKSILSLENRQQLKGSGSISDFEFKVLSEAATALGRNLSDADFKAQLEKVRDVFSGKYALTTQVSPQGKPQQMQLPNGKIVTLQADGTYQ